MEKRSIFIFSAVLAMLILINLMFPGDAPWINDEPIFIYEAYSANQNGEIPQHAMTGNLGIPYGAFAIWFYQLPLLLTKNLIAIIFIKTAISLFVIVFSLFIIGRTLKFTIYPLLLAVASPYFFHYNRLLWDNCFLILLSSLLLLFLVKFIYDENKKWLLGSAIVIGCMINLHLMSLFIIIPFVLTILIFYHKWILTHWKATVLSFIIFVLICTPYILSIKDVVFVTNRIEDTIVNSVSTALYSIKYFSFIGFASYFIPEIASENLNLPGPLYATLKLITGCAFIFFIIGFVSMVKGVYDNIKSKEQFSKETIFYSFCLLTVLSTIVLFILIRITPHPHYNNSISVVALLIIWLGIHKFWKNIYVKTGFWVYLASVAFLLLSYTVFIHQNGGSRGIHYGATIKNQIRIVKEVSNYDEKVRVKNRVDNYQKFPHAFKVLFLLYGEDKYREDTFKQVVIRYQNNDSSGWITLEELPYDE